MTSSAPLLELDGLEVRLGGRTVLAGLGGKLSGRVVGLLGPNGAGKTTLLATLLGFHRPHAGTARILGRDITSDRIALKSRLGYMPETDAYIAHLTAVRFVRMMAELAGLPPKPALERTHEALFYVGLGEARYRKLETYSLGMKQLAKLAQAIAHGPEVLLLDEPTNGLDPGARQRMLRLIREIADSGVRIVVSSHLLRDVETVCDEVIVLRQGQVATIANLAAERSENKRFLELETRGGDGEFAAALAALGCEVAELPNRRMKIVLPEGVAARELWRIAGERGVQLRRMTSSRNSLEHLFLRAMEENGAASDGRAAPARPGSSVPVYDRRYRGYSGERRSPRGLFWTLTRFGLAEVFSKRLLLVLFILACLPVVVVASLIYLGNNLDLLQVLGVRWTPDDEFEKTLSGTFFFWFMVVQANFAFLFAAFAGPSMVGPDLVHGAMPLYLSRPMRRGDYMLGKLAILGTLLSALTWVPGLLLVVLQASLAGGDWLVTNARIPLGIVAGSLLWIVFLSFASLAISAWIRWRPLATGALFVLFVLGGAFGSAINQIVDTRWGTLLVFGDQMRIIWVDLFAVENILGRFTGGDELPVVACWLSIAGLAALAALLLHRKIRAHEVVR